MAVCRFSYFNDVVEVDIPGENLVSKIDPPAAPAIPDVYGAARRACAKPTGAAPLQKGVAGKGRVLVTVPDKSRRTEIKPVLRALLDELAEAGVGDERVTILIALGTHRPMSGEEIAAKLGGGVAARYRVVNHDYDDPSALIDLGRTKEGLPVEFNRLVTEHDFVVSVGTISPHPVGGYSGGAKGLLPGVAGKRSTDYFHWEATRYPLFEVFGNADNPVRREMESIVDTVGLNFIVNVTENAGREVSGVFAGHFIGAHREGVSFLKRHPAIAFPAELPDMLVVGMGEDRPDFWGGAAGIYAASALLKEGGVLVLFASCPEGMAPEHPVVREYGYPRWRELRGAVERGEVKDRTGASHVVTVGKIIEEKKMRVLLVSRGICRDDAGRCGFAHFDGPQQAVDEALRIKGAGARILAYERI